MADALASFYSGRRVLVTGHTGFKGSWLTFWLRKMGARVVGVSLPPTSALSMFTASGLESGDDRFADVRDLNRVMTIFQEVKPEVVFHLAGQAIVGTAFSAPVETFGTNVMGTVNLLEAVRTTPGVEAAVMITSDKCYDNVEHIWGYREVDRLGGREPYSASKAAAELAIGSYTRTYFEDEGTPNVASARAGNVVGGGDWSDYRLVPDCVRSLRERVPIQLRTPQATRPWEHVLEALGGYLLLGMRLAQDGKKFQGGWNFGPDVDHTYTVERGAQSILEVWGEGSIQSGPRGEFRESTLLQLDCTKARNYLGWRSVMNFDETMRLTADWYKHQHQRGDASMREYSEEQLSTFEDRLNRTLPT